MWQNIVFMRVCVCVCAKLNTKPMLIVLSLVKFKENFYFSCGILFPMGFSSFLACVRNTYIDNFKTFYRENFQANREVARIASIVNILPI